MFRVFRATLGLVTTVSLSIGVKASESQGLAKITFDLSLISPAGLIGPRDRLRSIAYEFCLPANGQAVAEVRAIDPSLTIYPHSRGRIGCHREQYLGIGDTHQAKWREILIKLANLPYIEKIDQFFGE